MRHLGFSNAPIDEDDRCFYNLKALLHDAVNKLYLEAVPPRLNGIQVNASENLTPVAAKSRSAIVYWNTQQEAGQDVSTATDQASDWRPVTRTAPWNVSRTNHQVCMLDSL